MAKFLSAFAAAMLLVPGRPAPKHQETGVVSRFNRVRRDQQGIERNVKLREPHYDGLD